MSFKFILLPLYIKIYKKRAIAKVDFSLRNLLSNELFFTFYEFATAPQSFVI